MRNIDKALKKANEEDEIEVDLSKPGAGMFRLLRFTNFVNLTTFFAGILSFALVLLLNISLGPHN